MLSDILDKIIEAAVNSTEHYTVRGSAQIYYDFDDQITYINAEKFVRALEDIKENLNG